MSLVAATKWIAALVALPACACAAQSEDLVARAEAFMEQQEFGKAVELVKPYADAAHPDIEYELAHASYLLAVDGKKPEDIVSDDVKAAIELANRAAHDGNAGALNLLYAIYNQGIGTAPNEKKALEYLQRGVRAGDPGARLNYAIMAYRGTDLVAKDVDRACELFESLTPKGSAAPVANYYLGLVIYRGQCGHAKDPKRAMSMIEAAAHHGVRDAENDVAKNYEFGWTVKPDLSQALSWYETAAQHRQPHALWRVGMAYVNGEGCEKNPEKAVEYFRQGADAGDTDAMTSLAVMYVTGSGVGQDPARAKQLYEEAAEAGNAHAYSELAVMYLRAEGVPLDLDKAQELYERSISLGDEERPWFESELAQKRQQEAQQ